MLFVHPPTSPVFVNTVDTFWGKSESLEFKDSRGESKKVGQAGGSWEFFLAEKSHFPGSYWRRCRKIAGNSRDIPPPPGSANSAWRKIED